jgi:type III restriction enzyme
MLQEAKNIQNEAVDKLLNLLKNSKQKSLVFKAPTGSGKTYMIADLMNHVLAEDKNVIFMVSSLSKGNLAQQNHEKFESYGSTFTHLNPYLINSEISGEEQLFVPTEYNVYSLPLSLYKKGGRLMQGSLTNFFNTLTGGRLLDGLEKKIVLIKDECHIATNNLDDIPEAFISRIIDVSATPKLSRGQYPDVEISNEEAMQAKLIKTVEWGEDDAKLDDAIAKFESVKEEYRNLLGVNPCLIIQISNKDKADEELENEILPALNKTDLKWMLIVNDGKKCDTNDVMKVKKLPVDKWKKYAKENTSTIDVIIFKLTISEGWDIPRACMLYQIRDSKSKQLDEQVIGRVRRNPRLIDYEELSEEAQELATTAWIWGVKPEGQDQVFAVKLQGEEITDEIKVKTTRLKGLTEKLGFNVSSYLEGKDRKLAGKNLFELWRSIQNTDNSVQELINDYVTDYSKWWFAAENVEHIAKESNQYQNDYTESMEVVPNEVSFAATSFYTTTDRTVRIRDWVWKRRDGNHSFAFDSDAEEEWAEILKEIANDSFASMMIGDEDANTELPLDTPKEDTRKKILLWGKNYVGNSEIKFEYYMGALHSSYPDFVMKDAKGRIHVFEVKSVNESNSQPGFDTGLYLTKITELMKAYQQASKLTGQMFYLPIQTGNDWQITKYEDGNEDTLSIDQFESFITA